MVAARPPLHGQQIIVSHPGCIAQAMRAVVTPP
jgi:hypothetical protein